MLSSMRIAIIGTGYVGLCTGACFAELGNQVVCMDVVEEKINKLKKGIIPIYEPQLKEFVEKNVERKRLEFTTNLHEAVEKSDIIFIAVGTPPREDGSADLSYVENVALNIARCMNSYHLIVEKSTVPVQTGKRVERTIKEHAHPGVEFDVASNPEFLREGSAMHDFMHPDRIVLGVSSERAARMLKKLYEPLNAPIIVTDINSAEIIKHASNSFLATKISFINAVANICEKTGANIEEVARGIGLDKRIGQSFLNAGIGYGGSCFHPQELVFINHGKGAECLTFNELFYELDDWENIRILSANEKGLSWKKLLAVSSRQYHGEMIQLECSLGKKINLTNDHPVPIKTRGGIGVKLAQDVVEGDMLIVPLGQFEENEMIIDVLNELQSKEELLQAAYVSNAFLISDHFGEIRSSLSNTYVHDVKSSGTMRARDVVRMEKKMREHPRNRIFTVRSRSTTIPQKIMINGDFGRLLGYYAAEGWISQDRGRHGKIRKRIGFTFGPTEVEYVNDVKIILKSLDIKYTEKITPENWSIIVSSNALAHIFENVLCCGKNSYTKKIPPQILSSPESVKWEFVKGAFRGDGGVVRLNNNTNLTIEYGTVSRKLAHSLILLLQSLEIICSLKIQKMNKSTVAAYIVRINAINQIKKLGPLFGEKWKRYSGIADNYQKIITPWGYERMSHFVLVPVRKIKKYAYSGEVLSVETSNAHVVTSGGLLLHNCFPKDVSAFVKISEDLGYDFTVLREVESVNKKQKELFMKKIHDGLWNINGKTIGVLGLSFKPNTDDMREAPSIDIIQYLHKEGAHIKTYDPQAMDNAKPFLPKITYCTDPYDVAKDADALIMVTEWKEFQELDINYLKMIMKKPLIFDGRNMFDPKKLKSVGFTYVSVGR